MGKPKKRAQDRKWNGVVIRRERAQEVFEILDARPARFTPGDLVAMLVVTYGSKLIEKLRRAEGLT